MFPRTGLRFRMAVSYVVISAVAALLAAVLGWFVIPRALSPWVTVEYAKDAGRAPQHEAEMLATADAMGLGLAAADLAERNGDLSGPELLLKVAGRWAGQTAGPVQSSSGFTMIRAVAAPDGRLAVPSVPPVSGAGSAPPGFPGGTTARSGMGTRPGQPAIWATSPIQAGGQVIGVVYVWARDSPAADPAPPVITSGWKPNGTGWLGTALLALLLLVPVCAAFGLLSTRKLITRVERLSKGTAAMAKGDLAARVPVSGADEIGRLEEGFNTMSRRVEEAVRAEREAAGVQARLVERARMARELHDSVSQDLFSLNLVAGTLRRTLPPDSSARAQAETMEQTIGRTMREMRAMLLELRPVELTEAGLVPALLELCRTFEQRLGMAVTADLETVELDPRAEHALLRVAQEALGNAARHGGARTAELRLTPAGRDVELLVRDQGEGFDPDQVAQRHGLGLRLMRERIAEIGGTIEVESAPGAGTTVRVRVPATRGGQA